MCELTLGVCKGCIKGYISEWPPPSALTQLPAITVNAF